MKASSSEYSGGCESGWTVYFDQLSNSADQCNRSMPLHDIDCRSKEAGYLIDQDDEDENSSMISDASSGPPHFNHYEETSEEARYNNNSSASASENKKGKHRKKVKEQRNNQQNFYLDDTASSPFQNFSKSNALHTNDKYLSGHGSGISRGFSATQSKEKSVLRKHFGFMKPSHDRKSLITKRDQDQDL